ncbi:MAG TPA: hypothetical protein VIY52_23350 [Streptosporangiaceae bacterium]
MKLTLVVRADLDLGRGKVAAGRARRTRMSKPGGPGIGLWVA